MGDAEALASAIKAIDTAESPLIDDVWTYPPALKVLDCVLSLNRPYDNFVVPRVARLRRRRPDVESINSLLNLIASYDSAFEFSVAELNYTDEGRAATLVGVLEYLRRIQVDYEGPTEAARLTCWARAMEPEDYRSVNVKGFGLAGFQYLRMLFGAEAAKPDVHVIGFVSDTLGRPVKDVEALKLLEKAAEYADVSLRDTDVAIWEQRARESKR